jgi:hypothetical protein
MGKRSKTVAKRYDEDDKPKLLVSVEKPDELNDPNNKPADRMEALERRVAELERVLGAVSAYSSAGGGGPRLKKLLTFVHEGPFPPAED